MLRIMTSCAILLVADLAWAQTGLTYRFRADTVAGTVWVDGQNARQELESGEGGTAAGRIEIWRDGGRQVFVLDSVHRTYYEENAFRARMGVRTVSVAPFNVAPPFRLDGVENVRVDLKGRPRVRDVRAARQRYSRDRNRA